MAAILHALGIVGEKRSWRETNVLIRLHFVVEGQTEEGFVNTILKPMLAEREIFAKARRIETGRHRGRPYKGGFTRYEQLARDLTLWMREDQGAEAWFTTMVDFYALPADFPAPPPISQRVPPPHGIAALEEALRADVERRLDRSPVSRRFIPYIQMHEFEALLFSEPSAFAEAFPNESRLVQAIAEIRQRFQTPEDINGEPLTAPSKRILAIVPDYQKPVAGLIIAQRIGLTAMRRECLHFDDWIARLLSIGEPPPVAVD